MIGRADCLDVKPAVEHWKARGVDLSQVLYQPEVSDSVATRCVREPGPRAARRRSTTSSSRSAPARSSGASRSSCRCRFATSTGPWGRCSGHEITRRYGGDGLPDGTIRIKFDGSAGQSFGAFLP